MQPTRDVRTGDSEDGKTGTRNASGRAFHDLKCRLPWRSFPAARLPATPHSCQKSPFSVSVRLSRLTAIVVSVSVCSDSSFSVLSAALSSQPASYHRLHTLIAPPAAMDPLSHANNLDTPTCRGSQTRTHSDLIARDDGEASEGPTTEQLQPDVRRVVLHRSQDRFYPAAHCYQVAVVLVAATPAQSAVRRLRKSSGFWVLLGGGRDLARFMSAATPSNCILESTVGNVSTRDIEQRVHRHVRAALTLRASGARPSQRGPPTRLRQHEKSLCQCHDVASEPNVL